MTTVFPTPAPAEDGPASMSTEESRARNREAARRSYFKRRYGITNPHEIPPVRRYRKRRRPSE
jgi:hypothetical protein